MRLHWVHRISAGTIATMAKARELAHPTSTDRPRLEASGNQFIHAIGIHARDDLRWVRNPPLIHRTRGFILDECVVWRPGRVAHPRSCPGEPMNPGTICTLAASTCAALECLAAQVPAREKDFPRVISRAREVFSRAGTGLSWVTVSRNWHLNRCGLGGWSRLVPGLGTNAVV